MGNKITRRRPVIDERFTRPQGLYPHRDVDQRKLRRLIIEAKLAPCYPGAEEPATDLEECPICFLHYPSLNRSKCCTKGICTECFLQMKSPHAARPTQCPFCKTPNYAVEFRGAKTMEEKGMEQAEEQKVIETKIRMRNQEQQDDEERKQRREEDIRAGRIRVQSPRVQPIHNHFLGEIDGLNWRSGRGSADRASQALTTSAPLERIDSSSFWLDEDYQRAGGFDAATPPQQSALAVRPVPSSIYATESGFPVPQAPPGAMRGRPRDEEDIVDLENIMVMEAIWLSIQDQASEVEDMRSRPSEFFTEISLGSEADYEIAPAPPPLPPGIELEPWDQHSGRQGMGAGGLAGAIAALAERQVVGGDSTVQRLPSPPRPQSSNGILVEGTNNTGNGSQKQSPAAAASSQRGDMHAMPSTSDAENSSRASEKLANWVSSTQEEYKGSSMNTWHGDHSSEQVEVGTSFSSSVPSASELPWEAPEVAVNGESSGGNNNDKILVPDSFEEQIMLAMALSLADAQAKGRPGGNRSGPLPLADAQPRVQQQRQGNSRSGPLPRPTYIGH